MSSQTTVVAVINLSAYNYYFILFLFFPVLEVIRVFQDTVQSLTVLTVPHNVVLWAEANLTSKFMLFYFSKTDPLATLMVRFFKAASSSSHVIIYLPVRQVFTGLFFQ